MRKGILALIIFIFPAFAEAQVPSIPPHASRYEKFANGVGYTTNFDVGRADGGEHLHHFQALSFTRSLYNYLHISLFSYYESSEFKGRDLTKKKIDVLQNYQLLGHGLGLAVPVYDQFTSTADPVERNHLVKGGLGLSLYAQVMYSYGYLDFDREGYRINSNIEGGYATYDMRGIYGTFGLFGDYAFIKYVAIEFFFALVFGRDDLDYRIDPVDGKYQNAVYGFSPGIDLAIFPIDELKIVFGLSSPYFTWGDAIGPARPSGLDRDLIRIYGGLSGFFESTRVSVSAEDIMRIDDVDDEEDESWRQVPEATGEEKNWEEAPDAAPDGDMPADQSTESEDQSEAPSDQPPPETEVDDSEFTGEGNSRDNEQTDDGDSGEEDNPSPPSDSPQYDPEF